MKCSYKFLHREIIIIVDVQPLSQCHVQVFFPPFLFFALLGEEVAFAVAVAGFVAFDFEPVPPPTDALAPPATGAAVVVPEAGGRITRVRGAFGCAGGFACNNWSTVEAIEPVMTRISQRGILERIV